MQGYTHTGMQACTYTYTLVDTLHNRYQDCFYQSVHNIPLNYLGHSHKHILTHSQTHIHTHAWKHACMQAHTHTHTHTHNLLSLWTISCSKMGAHAHTHTEFLAKSHTSGMCHISGTMQVDYGQFMAWRHYVWLFFSMHRLVCYLTVTSSSEYDLVMGKQCFVCLFVCWLVA